MLSFVSTCRQRMFVIVPWRALLIFVSYVSYTHTTIPLLPPPYCSPQGV
jgi:hypothetical protein